MARSATAFAAASRLPPDATGLLNALPMPVIAVDEVTAIVFVNLAAEQFFDTSAGNMLGRGLHDFVPADSPLFALINHVRASGATIVEYELTIESPRIRPCTLTVQVAPHHDLPGGVIASFQEQSIARKIDDQLLHRGAARSITAMAAMLAHEVKNPLSGIRGAAQLLDRDLDVEGRRLTKLICDETDRICALVDRMDVFSDQRPAERSAVNIHQVLEHARQLAESGFARHVRFIESYDPSLPPVRGNRDTLIQVVLNLIKNAAEAAPQVGGEIMLSTAYRHGVRLEVPGTDTRVHLPLELKISDNGPGLPDDIREHLFDPFITTKPHGSGLGLALVAKIISDHGGVIDVDSRPGRTEFRIMLPIHRERRPAA
jgi:two-component system nitrogen regulation sensor histidine kinase GlnL